MDKQKKILIGLGIIFAVTLAYRISHPWKQAEVEKLKYDGSQTYRKGSKVPIKAGDGKTVSETFVSNQSLIIEDFLNPPRHSSKIHRDLFFSKELETKIKEPLEKTDNLQAQIENPIEDIKPEVPEVDPLENADAQVKKYHIFGIYQTGSDFAAFLQREKQVIVVRKGNIIDGKYTIEEISKEMIRLNAEHLTEPLYLYFE